MDHSQQQQQERLGQKRLGKVWLEWLVQLEHWQELEQQV